MNEDECIFETILSGKTKSTKIEYRIITFVWSSKTSKFEHHVVG